MKLIAYFIVTLIIGAAGGIFAKKLKVPAGGIVGAMLAVALFNVLTGNAVFYRELRIVVQMVMGIIIGSQIKKKDVLALQSIIIPTVILLISLFSMNLLTGYAMYRFSNLDFATSLFASAPGGISEMPIIGVDFGGDPGSIALLQLVRLIAIFMFMPAIFRKVIVKEPQCKDPTDESLTTGLAPKIKLSRLLLTLLIGGIGGMLFYLLRIPAGAIIGAMVFTTIFSVVSNKALFPSKTRLYMQIASGVYIGSQINMSSINNLQNLLLPALISVISVFIFTFLTAMMMRKFTKLPLSTCLLASTPGGLQEMSILADELGADIPKIALMQTIRLISVIVFAPSMISFVLHM